MAISGHRSEPSLKLHRPPFSQFTHNSGVFQTLSSWEIFMFQWIRLSFIHKTHALSSLLSNCYVCKLASFHEPRFGRSSLNISLLDSVFRLEKIKAKELTSTCWPISVCELFQIGTLMLWHLLTALILINRSDYSHYTNKKLQEVLAQEVQRKQSISSRVSPYTSFVLELLPACFTTE